MFVPRAELFRPPETMTNAKARTGCHAVEQVLRHSDPIPYDLTIGAFRRILAE